MEKRKSVIIVLLVLLLLAGVCSAQGDEIEPTLDPTVRPTPAPTPIKLSEGKPIECYHSKVVFDKGSTSVQDKFSGITVSSDVVIGGTRVVRAASTTTETSVTWEDSGYSVTSEYRGRTIKETVTITSDTTISYPLTLSAGSQLIPQPSGDIHIRNGKDGGKPGIVIAKPYGIDATDRYIPMEYNITGTTLNLIYDRTGIVYPLVIDPTYYVAGGLFDYYLYIKQPHTDTVDRYGRVASIYVHNLTGTNGNDNYYITTGLKNSTFSDLKFVSLDGTIIYSHFIPWKNTTSAQVLVSMPVVSATTGAEFVMAYGNDSIASNQTYLPRTYAANNSAYYSQDTERFPFYAGNGLYDDNTTIAFSDDFSVDTNTRYAQLNKAGATWSSAAGEVTVSGGAMTHTSATANWIVTPLKSYKFQSGNYTVSFVDKSSGTSTRDHGIVFGWQDYNNYYIFNISDTLAGAKNVSFYKVAAGTTTLIGSMFQNQTNYLTSNNLTTLEVYFDSERGVMTGYVYNATYMPKNATADSTAYSATFSYGRAGMRSGVTTAGTLLTVYDDLTIRANLLVGRTNVPATEPGWYFADGFERNSVGRTTRLYGDSAETMGGAGVFTLVGGTLQQNLIRIDSFRMSTVDISIKMKSVDVHAVISPRLLA